MSNNCINLKQKLNGKLECKKLHKIINIKDCNSCKFREYHIPEARKKIKSKSRELSKLERKRSSLFTEDLDHCFICGKKKEHLHEVFFGKNRQNSMKYNLVLPLCDSCHKEMHKNINLQLEYKKRGQELFNRTYPDLIFIDIFRENYL